MAVLHNKEQKIEVVLSKLPKKYTDAQFVEKFIQLYSKDWGKIKANYIKQSQDKEPGTVINMPKPDMYLKHILNNYLNNRTNPLPVKEQPVDAEATVAPVIDEKPATGITYDDVPAAKDKPTSKAKAIEKVKADPKVKVAAKAKVAVKAKPLVEENAPAEKKTAVKKASAIKAAKVDEEVKIVKEAKVKAEKVVKAKPASKTKL